MEFKKRFSQMKTLVLLALLFFAPTLFAASFSNLHVGDIIFQKSQSSQSKALKEATGSEWTHVGVIVQSTSKKWYVAEAIGPVVATPINTFIARGKNKEYRIYRWKYFDPSTMTQALYKSLRAHNRPYDIYFEMSDDRIYCSELVYKAMLEVTGRDLGTLQHMRDMKLDGPYVKALINKRYTETGKEFDLNEEIITPISQMRDANLVLVKSSN